MPRTAVVPVRFEPSEHLFLKQAAGGLALSEYIRRAALGKRRLRRRIPAINREAYLELSRLSSNLNQLARACNVALRRGDSLPLDIQMFANLQEMIRSLRFELIVPPDFNEYEGDEIDDW